jgi:hypothetical protein
MNGLLFNDTLIVKRRTSAEMIPILKWVCLYSSERWIVPSLNSEF